MDFEQGVKVAREQFEKEIANAQTMSHKDVSTRVIATVAPVIFEAVGNEMRRGAEPMAIVAAVSNLCGYTAASNAINIANGEPGSQLEVTRAIIIQGLAFALKMAATPREQLVDGVDGIAINIKKAN